MWLALLPAIGGCAAHLPAQSFLAPAANGRTYSRFIVYAAFKDLGAEGAFERAMCAALIRAGNRCETMLRAVPPDLKQNAANRQRAMHLSGARAALVIELADPTAESRLILADGRPGYRVTLIDVAGQQVMARLAIDGRAGSSSLAARGGNVANAVLRLLAARGLITR